MNRNKTNFHEKAMSESRFKPALLNGRHQYSATVFFKLKIIGVHAHSAPVGQQCRAHKVDTSPAIHWCHAYGIVRGRLLYAYAMPMILNWVKMLSRCINAVGWLKRLHTPWCIHKMQAILSVIWYIFSFVVHFSGGNC